MRTFGVFCKHPRPGQVKTRLAEHIGPASAVTLAAAFLDDLTLEFRNIAQRRILGYSPADSAHYFHHFSRFGYDLWPQPEGDLGARLSAFFSETLQTVDDRTVLIGSDSPTIPREYVQLAFEKLDEFDCVVGPAMDGGYYLVGLRRCIPQLFENIVWSGASVLHQTVQRISGLGLSLGLLPPWYDIDDLDDLWMLAGHIQALTRSGQTHPCPVTATVLRQLHLG
ncbi:MAG: TIGR04282 family arsenosugar biosynthesis glycosyltransferase [Planctomycetes bacterium]|nr:TIGR04282 family arsenosugar biosynthesis glycosyltransferase [Planctomycetota bacterium]